MRSRAATIKLVPNTADSMESYEVNHDTYATEVLGLKAGITEDVIDNELVAKANSLGIAASTLQKRNTSSAFSFSTSGSAVDQTFSSASSPLAGTPHSSVFGRSSTDLACNSATGFGQYDQFVAVVDTPMEQMRFRKGSLPVINSSAQSVFSVSTNKSFSSVKSGFKPRPWWKKKDPSVYVGSRFQCCHEFILTNMQVMPRMSRTVRENDAIACSALQSHILLRMPSIYGQPSVCPRRKHATALLLSGYSKPCSSGIPQPRYPTIFLESRRSLQHAQECQDILPQQQMRRVYQPASGCGPQAPV